MMYAYCFRGGQIEFGRRIPNGALPVGNSACGRTLREIVTVNARHAYDGITLLVPGVPEAISEDEGVEKVRIFREIVRMRLAGECGYPTTSTVQAAS